ncbi:hypothetical protein ACFQX6_31320 [Streptosporangium lutulentum]
MLTRRPGQRPWQILRCLALIDLARPDEARAVFARLSRDDFAEIGPDLAYRFVPDAVSEICAALGDVAAGRVLYGRLAPNAGRLLGWSVTDLCLARLALLDGDERAPAHLRAAEAFVGEAGLRVYEPALRALADFHVSRVSCEPCRLGVSPPPYEHAANKGMSFLESEFTVTGVGMCAWLGKHGAYLSTAEGRCNDRDLAG